MMAELQFAKLVDALPAVLQPHTVYYVLVGGVCKQYITDATGTVVYPVLPGDTPP